MKALSLILRIIAIVGAIAAAYFFFAVKGQLKESGSQLASAKKTAAEQSVAAETARELLQKQVESLQTEKSELDVRLGDEKRRVAELNSNLIQDRNEMARVQQDARAKQTELTGLKARIASMQTELSELRSQGSPAELKQRVTELEAATVALTAELAAAKQAATIVSVAPGGAAGGVDVTIAQAAPLSLDGTFVVLYADRGAKLMTLSLGANKGLQEGMLLNVSVEGKAYGEVLVKSVRDDMSVVYMGNKSLLKTGTFITLSQGN